MHESITSGYLEPIDADLSSYDFADKFADFHLFRYSFKPNPLPTIEKLSKDVRLGDYFSTDNAERLQQIETLLKVVYKEDQNIIEIRVKHSDPKLAQDLVDVFFDTMRDKQIESIMKSRQQLSKGMDNQLSSMMDNILDLRNSISSLDKRRQIEKSAKRQDLDNKYIKYTKKLSDMEKDYDSLKLQFSQYRNSLVDPQGIRLVSKESMVTSS